MEQQPSSSLRAQRNLKEKNRRMHMRDLSGKLASLITSQPSKLSMPEIVDRATSYILQLQKNEESLKRRRALLTGDHQERNNLTACNSSKILPTMIITNLDSSLEVNLICGLMNSSVTLSQVITVLEEEGAEVIDATQRNAGDRVIYIIKSKAIISRIGIETSRIQERLKELIL